jgi:hypothetical protein
MEYRPFENNIDSILNPRFYGDKFTPEIIEASNDPHAALGKKYNSNSRIYVYCKANGAINFPSNPQTLSALTRVVIDYVAFTATAISDPGMNYNGYAIRSMKDGQYGAFCCVPAQVAPGTGTGGTFDYNDLGNKPSLNNSTLVSNTTIGTNPSDDIQLEIDYTDLNSKPLLNSVQLEGDVTIGTTPSINDIVIEVQFSDIINPPILNTVELRQGNQPQTIGLKDSDDIQIEVEYGDISNTPTLNGIQLNGNLSIGINPYDGIYIEADYGDIIHVPSLNDVVLTTGNHTIGCSATPEIYDIEVPVNYNAVSNLPALNMIELIGNKTIGISPDKDIYILAYYEDISGKPTLNEVEIVGDKTIGTGLSDDILISVDYEGIANKPRLNGTLLDGDKSIGNSAQDNVFLDLDYVPLIHKPSLNQVELFQDHYIASAAFDPDIVVEIDYADLAHKPSLNGVEISGSMTIASAIYEPTIVVTVNYADILGVPSFGETYAQLPDKPALNGVMLHEFNQTIGAGATDDYDIIIPTDYVYSTNKPILNGVTLLGSMEIGTSSIPDADIVVPIDYADALNKPILNGIDLLSGETMIGSASIPGVEIAVPIDFDDLINVPPYFDATYASLPDKPQLNTVTLQNDMTIGIGTVGYNINIPASYNDINNLPSLNGVQLITNKTIGSAATNDIVVPVVYGDISGIPNVPGLNGVPLDGNKTIGASTGTEDIIVAVDYARTTSKPTLNTIELVGDKTISSSVQTTQNIHVAVSYTDVTDKPSLNTIELSGAKTISSAPATETNIYVPVEYSQINNVPPSTILPISIVSQSFGPTRNFVSGVEFWVQSTDTILPQELRPWAKVVYVKATYNTFAGVPEITTLFGVGTPICLEREVNIFSSFQVTDLLISEIVLSQTSTGRPFHNTAILCGSLAKITEPGAILYGFAMIETTRSLFGNELESTAPQPV